MNLTQADKRVLNNLQIPYDLRKFSCFFLLL